MDLFYTAGREFRFWGMCLVFLPSCTIDDFFQLVLLIEFQRAHDYTGWTVYEATKDPKAMRTKAPFT